jgi:hypothetical protein
MPETSVFRIQHHDAELLAEERTPLYAIVRDATMDGTVLEVGKHGRGRCPRQG